MLIAHHSNGERFFLQKLLIIIRVDLSVSLQLSNRYKL
jgi:hypothetical protein